MYKRVGERGEIFIPISLGFPLPLPHHRLRGRCLEILEGVLEELDSTEEVAWGMLRADLIKQAEASVGIETDPHSLIYLEILIEEDALELGLGWQRN